MITPRTTRLIRVPDLRAMHRVSAERIRATPAVTAVIVPTAAAREALARTLVHLEISPDTFDLVTREDLYVRMHETLGLAPALSAFEREVLFMKAAEEAAGQGDEPPFRLRAGLVAEILAFYDELRRRDRTIADFDRLMTSSLEPSIEIDRGAERLLRQTRFLVSAFDAFERLVASSGRMDEHLMRRHLLASTSAPAYTHIVVTVADQAADRRGLWTADFDLLARLHGVDTLDIVSTENVLAAGFHQRVHDLLPGIEEVRGGVPAPPPVLLVPEPTQPDIAARWFVARDREDELVAVARRAALSEAARRLAVVFQRPLPYLYLARSVFDAAGTPYQTPDAFPLAAEPFAAAVDLVFDFLLAEGNRASTIALLGSPHWKLPFLEPGDISVREKVGALDAFMRESKYLGGWEALASLSGGGAPAEEAAQAARAAAEAVRPVRDNTAASRQIAALLEFVSAFERLPEADSPVAARHSRARAAILGALDALAAAHQRYDDRPLPVERLASAVRRWIEGQTFAARTGDTGLLLLDAPAAAYAAVDDVRLVGLIENDWPERLRRSIFYPSHLLSQLGWPPEAERLAAARARFHDLLRLAVHSVSVSSFTLEDDSIVPPSSFLEELEVSGLAIERVPGGGAHPVLPHERLLRDDFTVPDDLMPASEWLALRRSRSPGADAAYRGAAGSQQPRVYAVSHIERYLSCPFKYFAGRVLQLDEERDDESGLSALERGQLLHDVFEKFFAEWHARGGRGITTETLKEALDLFQSVAARELARLPEADRALERTYLLGSAVAPGLAERAFNFEIEQGIPVLERLLEHRFEGTFQFQSPGGPRSIAIRGTADRIDLLEDGTLRVIDYKLGRAPKPGRALQLPIYGICAEQSLAGRRGRQWTLSRAGYVAFKEKNAFVSLASNTVPLDAALTEGQHRLVAAVEAIERGEFPVAPDEPFLCTRCGYAGVCRKDYIGDE